MLYTLSKASCQDYNSSKVSELKHHHLILLKLYKAKFYYKNRKFKCSNDAERIGISQYLIKGRPFNWSETPKINELSRNDSNKSLESTQPK